ncbi:MAG: hypothetical protein WC648_01440 [Candidatus Paceibacterota bacterium]|jgi:hypothetical protein
MDIEDLKKIVDGKPADLIKFAADRGIDFSGLEKDIARKMVKKRFSLSDEQFDAVDFVFWIAYFVEREAEDLIIEPEVHAGVRKEAMEAIISKLHFGSKITIIEELHCSKNDPFIKIMRQIQDLRNHVAHGRFDNLKYKGYSLNDNRGKLTLIADLRDALLKK